MQLTFRFYVDKLFRYYVEEDSYLCKTLNFLYFIITVDSLPLCQLRS